MDIIKWANDKLKRFPTDTTNVKKDEWYGVENGVDVLEIAIAIKRLQSELSAVRAEKEKLTNLISTVERNVKAGAVTMQWVEAFITQALQAKGGV